MKLPLSTLIIKLEHAGLPLSPAEQLKVQEVLHKLGNKYLHEPQKLVQILSPAIAKSQEEQIIFQEVFENYWEDAAIYSPIRNHLDFADEFPPLEQQVQQSLNKKRGMLYPLAALVFLAGLFIISGTPFFTQKSSPNYPITNEGVLSSVLSKKATKVEQGVAGLEKEVYGEAAQEILSPKQVEDIQFTIGHGPRHVIAGEKFNFLLESTQNLGGLPIQWDLGDGTYSDQLKPTHSYSEEGIYTVSLRIADQIKAITFPVYPVGTSYTSFASAEIAKQEAIQSRIKWQVFFLAFFMILAIEGYLEKFKQKQYSLAFKQYFHRGENAPYTLPYPTVQEQLRAEPGMFSLAESLKKRKISAALGLDIKSSLYETVQAGGFPQLVYSPEKTSSEYLVLIDESGPSDHQAMLFEQFVSLLKKEEVLIQSFRFRNDPRTCYNEEYPEGIELDLISRRLPADRLLIFSKGSFFLDLKSHQLADWIEEVFAPWQQKVILTPEPRKSWGFRERALQNSFHVLPADLDAQQGILEALLSDDIENATSLQDEALVSSYAEAPLSDYNFESKEDLHDYLGDALYKWLMASMVTSDQSWAMTMKVGKALEEKQGLLLDGSKLVSYDNLLKLSNIPWLQEGEVPIQLRKELIDELDEETEIIARHAVLELLNEIEVPENSHAQQQKLIEQSVQEAALYPDNQGLQKKMRFLWQNGMLHQSMRGMIDSSPKAKLFDFVRRHQRALTPAIIGTLFLATTAFLGVNLKSYSNDALVEKYFEVFPTELNLEVDLTHAIIANKNNILNSESDLLHHTFTNKDPHSIEGARLKQDLLKHEKALMGNLFLQGISQLAAKDYTKASQSIQAVEINGFGIELKAWYLALSYLGQEKEEEARFLLSEIKKDPNNLYYYKAISLEKDLDDFWRF